MLRGRIWWALCTLGLLAGCGQEVREVAKLPPLSGTETDPEVFGRHYPRHFDSYQRNRGPEAADLKEVSEFGGSIPYSKLEANPDLRRLFQGSRFFFEYNEDRGHVRALEDVARTKRVFEKTTATCLTCKSAQVPRLIQTLGPQYYTTPFSEIMKAAKDPISCSDCHNPKTMELRITRPALREAMARRGVDVDKATRQEMRSYVCAQCHVEYYFQPGTVRLVFPWDKGFTPDEVYQYYEEIKFKDHEHPATGTPLLKAQHPEFDMFQGSTHQSAGAACADCHMPYTKEGNAKISSHWWTSPLKTLQESCGACHRQDAGYLRSRVLDIQRKTADLQKRAARALVEAIAAIEGAAKTSRTDAKLLEEARQLHRRGQWYWDWVDAENSMGFHNPPLAMNTSGRAIDLAHRAGEAAVRAKLTGGPAGPLR
jgi:nitrite reductase (cytochrome c-552)